MPSSPGICPNCNEPAKLYLTDTYVYDVDRVLDQVDNRGCWIVEVSNIRKEFIADRYRMRFACRRGHYWRKSLTVTVQSGVTPIDIAAARRSGGEGTPPPPKLSPPPPILTMLPPEAFVG